MTEKERKNPFFEKYTTPHATVPFDCIRLEDYEEAFIEGIRRDDEQIAKIIDNPEPPTFDNTIINQDEDHEGYYDLLSKVSTVFFNLLSAETNDDMDALAQKLQPILTKHANDVKLNEKLFARIKAVHLHHRRLTPEEKKLLDDCYEGFVRSGALLDAEGKERLRKLTEEAGMLSLQFSQNLLKENKAFSLDITDEEQLEGLPDTAREAAAQTAKEQGKQGWVFTLDFPSYSPFMTYSAKRELRRQMYMAKNTECTHDNAENNIEICKRLINLRREIAQLLGSKTYADHVLKRRMAGNRRNVYDCSTNWWTHIGRRLKRRWRPSRSWRAAPRARRSAWSHGILATTPTSCSWPNTTSTPRCCAHISNLATSSRVCLAWPTAFME